MDAIRLGVGLGLFVVFAVCFERRLWFKARGRDTGLWGIGALVAGVWAAIVLASAFR